MKIRTRLSSPETENPKKWAANATASLAAGSARLRALVAEWGVEAGKKQRENCDVSSGSVFAVCKFQSTGLPRCLAGASRFMSTVADSSI
jgi:hypothetical protein